MARGKIEYEGVNWPMVFLTGAAAVAVLYVGSIILSSKTKISHFLNPITAYHSIFKPTQKQAKEEEVLQPTILEQEVTKQTIPKSPKYVGQQKQKQKRDISKLPEPQKHGGFLTSVAMNYKNTYNLSNLTNVPAHITLMTSSGETLYVIDTLLHSSSKDTTIVKESKIEKLLKSGEEVIIKQEHNHTIR